MLKDMRCRIELLGGLRVRQGDQIQTRFETRKTAALLAILALGLHRSHPREALLEQLLPGFYEEWIVAERERLAEAQWNALCQLAAASAEVGDLPGAIATARRAVTLDPLREEAHCTLMRLYAASGRPVDALRQYRELE